MIKLKDIEQYGLLNDDEWECLPWIPDPRPSFKIWVKPEEIEPFFIVQHYPYSLSLLLKMDSQFKIDVFHQMGLEGSSKNWETFAKGLIKEYEENNSGIDLFQFDSDKDMFCVFSQYVDDLMILAKIMKATCNDEKAMYHYLNYKENEQTSS